LAERSDTSEELQALEPRGAIWQTDPIRREVAKV